MSHNKHADANAIIWDVELGYRRSAECNEDRAEFALNLRAQISKNKHKNCRNQARNQPIFNCSGTFFIAQKTSNRAKHDFPLKSVNK